MNETNTETQRGVDRYTMKDLLRLMATRMNTLGYSNGGQPYTRIDLILPVTQRTKNDLLSASVYPEMHHDPVNHADSMAWYEWKEIILNHLRTVLGPMDLATPDRVVLRHHSPAQLVAWVAARVLDWIQENEWEGHFHPDEVKIHPWDMTPRTRDIIHQALPNLSIPPIPDNQATRTDHGASNMARALWLNNIRYRMQEADDVEIYVPLLDDEVPADAIMEHPRMNNVMTMTIMEFLNWFASYMDEYGSGPYITSDFILPLSVDMRSEVEEVTDHTITFETDSDSREQWENWKGYIGDRMREDESRAVILTPADVFGVKKMTVRQLREWMLLEINDYERCDISEDELAHPWDFDEEIEEKVRNILPLGVDLPHPVSLMEINPSQLMNLRRQALADWHRIMINLHMRRASMDVHLIDEVEVTNTEANPRSDAYLTLFESTEILRNILQSRGLNLSERELFPPISPENRMHILNATGVYPPSFGPDNENAEVVKQWREMIKKILRENKGIIVHWIDGPEAEAMPDGYVHPWLRQVQPDPANPVTPLLNIVRALNQTPTLPRQPTRLPGAQTVNVPGINVGAAVDFTISGTESRQYTWNHRVPMEELAMAAREVMVDPIPGTYTQQQFAIEMANKLNEKAVRHNEAAIRRGDFQDESLYADEYNHGDNSPDYDMPSIRSYNETDIMDLAAFCYDWIQMCGYEDIRAYNQRLTRADTSPWILPW